MNRSKPFRMLVVLVLAMALVVPMTKPSEAFDPLSAVWALLAGPVTGFVNQVFFPDKIEAWIATSPALMIDDNKGNRLPPVPMSRQLFVGVRKGAKFRALKPGPNGPAIGLMKFRRDGDEGTEVTLRQAPWEIGTGNPHLENRGWFDTALDHWQHQEIYTLGLELFGIRDERVDGDKPAYTAVQVGIYNEEPFKRAVVDPEYRANLFGIGMAGYPAIPISALVDASQNVGFSLAQDGSNPLWMLQQGLTQPQQPVAGQQQGGLDFAVALSQIVNSEAVGTRALAQGEVVTLTLSQAKQHAVVLTPGELATSTTVIVVRQDNTVVYSKTHNQYAVRRIWLDDPTAYPPGHYQIRALATGADGSVGNPVTVQVTITEEGK